MTKLQEVLVFDKKSPREATPIVAETVLSNQIRLEGRLRSTSNIRFDGEMLGDLSTEGDLSVGEQGSVKGNVNGRNVVVGGTIQGNVTAAGRLEILASGKVFGDITVASLIIDEGGVLRGKSAMNADGTTASFVSVGVRAEATTIAA